MKLFKFLFVVMSLLSAIPCFGRRVHLDGNWKHSKKSILVDLPMDASIEEASGELIVNFHENVLPYFQEFQNNRWPHNDTNPPSVHPFSVPRTSADKWIAASRGNPRN